MYTYVCTYVCFVDICRRDNFVNANACIECTKYVAMFVCTYKMHVQICNVYARVQYTYLQFLPRWYIYSVRNFCKIILVFFLVKSLGCFGFSMKSCINGSYEFY